jgi:DNA repair protein RadC
VNAPSTACITARIKAALELGTRLTMERNHTPKVHSPADAASLVMAEMGLLALEELRTILLDTKNHVVGIPTIYVGSINTTMIRGNYPVSV